MFILGAILSTWFLTLSPPATASSRESAQALVQAMSAKHMDAFAVVDPADASHFVAVRLYPGQLLLITGRYPAPTNLTYDMAQRHYAEIYSALYASVEPDGRLFVQDMGADGLAASRNDAADIVYEQAGTQWIVDRGPSGKARDPYDAMYTEVDRRYAAALKLLLSQLTPGATTEG
jgi:hypothetical protein